MEQRLCPECLGALEVRAGGGAHCTVHGGDYQILFWRGPKSSSPPGVFLKTGFCRNHPRVPAKLACRDCDTEICELCSFRQEDGSHLCPACVTGNPPGSTPEPAPVTAEAPPPMLALQNQKCPRHPNVAAVQICRFCNTPMCATCDFVFPGNLHVCPACATAPQPPLDLKRKKMLVAAYALAIWSTLVMGALRSGMFASMVRTKADQQALGMLLILILVIPSITGLSLGISAMDRRRSKTIGMWIATLWNGVILGGFVLLMIIGMLKGR